MEQVLLVVQVIIAIGLIGLVLIQRSDSDGFGLSGGSGNNLLSGRAGASAMTRVTAIFAAAFIINSLALGVLAARNAAPSIADTIEQEQSSGANAVPSVPLAGAEDKNTQKKPESSEKTTEELPAAPVEGEAAPAPKAKKKAADAKAESTESTENNE